MLIVDDLELPEATVYLIKMTPIEGLYERLREEIAWQRKSITVYGRTVLQPRLVAWYGDDGTDYRYSGTVNAPSPWTPNLIEVRDAITDLTGISFNSVLLNLYRDGADSIGFHSDDEPELGADPVIASLSLGGSRTFIFRHKNKEYGDAKIDLVDHDLLIMAGSTQKNWLHGINKVANAAPRINLTFRQIIAK